MTGTPDHTLARQGIQELSPRSMSAGALIASSARV